MEQLIVGLILLLVPSMAWVAYNHPKEYERALVPGMLLLGGALLFSFGYHVGVSEGYRLGHSDAREIFEAAQDGEGVDSRGAEGSLISTLVLFGLLIYSWLLLNLKSLKKSGTE